MLHLPSVASRVFQTEVWIEFPERAGMEKCTGMVPSTSTKTWEVEVQSSYSSEVCRMHGIDLIIRTSSDSEESSRTRWVWVEFNIQNAETYMTLGTYILEETKSGMLSWTDYFHNIITPCVAPMNSAPKGLDHSDVSILRPLVPDRSDSRRSWTILGAVVLGSPPARLNLWYYSCHTSEE